MLLVVSWYQAHCVDVIYLLIVRYVQQAYVCHVRERLTISANDTRYFPQNTDLPGYKT